MPATFKQELWLGSYFYSLSVVERGLAFKSVICDPKKLKRTVKKSLLEGDRIKYPGAVATPTAEILVSKLLFNSLISTKDARSMAMDISNFYLMTPLPHPE